MKRKPILFLLISTLVIVIAFVAYQNKDYGESAYKETLISYLEAMKDGTDAAIKYTAFPNDTIEYDYLHSPICVVDYEIVSSVKVNENLYAFTLNIATSNQPEVYTPLYYFVGCQNAKYTVYINASYVPEELCDNFNINDYSYSNFDYLGDTPQFDES